jgi:hypothetical protein
MMPQMKKTKGERVDLHLKGTISKDICNVSLAFKEFLACFLSASEHFFYQSLD